MGIPADKMKLYPGGSILSHEWKTIRERIQARAGDCCEECGVPNHAVGYRLPSGPFVPTPLALPGRIIKLSPAGGHFFPQVKIIKIVCTVAHLDGKLVDHSDGNLKFLCQKHHLKLDAEDHAMNAAATRAAKKAI